MVSSELYLAVEDDYFANNMKEMIGGCCVCSDERGWAENPLVYCDGHGCNVAVHQGKQYFFNSWLTALSAVGNNLQKLLLVLASCAKPCY